MANVIVTTAGNATYNDTYWQSGTYNGKPAYLGATGGRWLCYVQVTAPSGFAWVLNASKAPISGWGLCAYYYGIGTQALPPNGTYATGGQGTAPAAVVNYYPTQKTVHWKPQRGCPIIAGHPLARGLVGCWLFNEGAGDTAYDISGQDNHGTLIGMDPDTDWVGSEQGWALDFDATNDHVAVTSGTLDIAGQDFTIVALIRPGNIGADEHGIMTRWETTSQFNFRVTTAGELQIFTRDASAAAARTTTNASLAVGTWATVACAFNNTTDDAYLYQDGVLLADDGTALKDPRASTDELRIGSAGASGFSDPFTGQIACAYLYWRQLAGAEIAYLNAFPYCFIDQGEMAWLNMIVAGGALQELSGSAAGLGATTALLRAIMALSGTATGAGSTTALLAAIRSLAGSAAGAGLTTAQIHGIMSLIGSAGGQGLTAAQLHALLTLTGSAAGQGATSAILTLLGVYLQLHGDPGVRPYKAAPGARPYKAHPGPRKYRGDPQ